LQVLLGHLASFAISPARHRVGDTGIVKVEREPVVHLDALLIFFMSSTLTPRHALAVVHPGFGLSCRAS
jgi:hypothetical protein